MRVKKREPNQVVDDMLAIEMASAKLLTDDDQCIRTLRGCLENLVKELRAAPAATGRCGLKVSVAIAASERALKRYPASE